MNKKVSFIGLGIMGSRMAANLLKNNIELKVYNRTRENINDESLLKIACDTPDECVKDADVIFTMLSTPSSVDEAAFGENGFLDHAKKDSLWIDCTTVDPAFSIKTFGKAKEKGIRFIDIPVSGSKPQAEKGELIFLAGADEKEIDEIRELLMFMGSKVIAGNKRGNGSNLKMLINSMLGQGMAAFSETVSVGKSMGFEKEMLLEILSGLTVTPPFIQFKTDMIKNDTYIVNFPLEWMLKDMKLYSKTAEELDRKVTMADAAKKLYEKALELGYKREDFAAIFRAIDKSADDTKKD
jgi:3-hydroxyisobutyrate dehydrogenase/glyoxylate/succinic semialdehyde reductase